MRLSTSAFIALGALVAIAALGATDRILPATDVRIVEVRPWVAARALGVTAYILLAAQVWLGIILSHPRNTSAWSMSKVVFPWHEMITVFTGAFLVLHVALLALDPYAKVGVIGAFVPGLSEYRSPAVALGTVALYSMIVTAVTARWTRLLPAGWWLKVHRLAAVAFLLSWAHAVLAGTDGGALLPLYLGTGLPVLAFAAHRWWARRTPPAWATSPGEAPPAAARANSAPGRPLPVAVTVEDR